ncbi:HPP family protein [Pontibacterium granulatum]|uniref:HPP family protein n=1 Tax=Pontibacterium granulatum TaxID=2036029 RepID=UPI00249C56C8|nr:HPP family protein [Pontibacterium granulatum]MDI3325785.1 HPP family protein [Pontibacterium granulatum]
MKLRKLFSYFVPEPSTVSLAEQLRSVVAAFLAISLLMIASRYSQQGESAPLLLASMGASAVILFAAYNSPLAQPWPFVGSHLLSATIGVSCALWVEPVWLACSVAVALALLIMLRLHCLHPPGCATALVPILSGNDVHELGYRLLITPVLLNVVVLLGLTLLLNRFLLGRKYPYWPKEYRENPHRLRDPRPQERLGVGQVDIAEALQQFDGYLDVSEDDLNKVYRLAEANAHQRQLSRVLCRELMSKDLVTVAPETSQQHAWGLLQKHRIKALPVVDEARHVVGIVTLIDFLKPLGLQPSGMNASWQGQTRVANLVRRLPFFTARSENVASIMTPHVLTVDQDQPLMQMMPMLCESELHHIPVVDQKQRLVGMMTPSDLLAALYASAKGPVVDETTLRESA